MTELATGNEYASLLGSTGFWSEDVEPLIRCLKRGCSRDEFLLKKLLQNCGSAAAHDQLTVFEILHYPTAVVMGAFDAGKLFVAVCASSQVSFVGISIMLSKRQHEEYPKVPLDVLDTMARQAVGNLMLPRYSQQGLGPTFNLEWLEH